jgi:RimJ/RimL family protein N-acetyltransferase
MSGAKRMEGMPSLETERLELRPLALDDAPHFARLFGGDWEAIRHTGRMPYPPSEPAMRRWITAHLGPGGHAFLLIRKGDRAVVGAAGFGGAGATAELGYALGRPHWNQGLATEAVLALIACARELGLDALDAYSFLDNPASARVLIKAGFAERGVVLRDYAERGGMREVRHFQKILTGGT